MIPRSSSIKGTSVLLCGLALLAVAWRVVAHHPAAPTALGPIQGELIADDSSALPAPLPESEIKKRHPKPASVQRRMVLAQWTLSQQGNADTGLAAGTLGNAGDWAKIKGNPNLNVETRDVQIPGYRAISFSALSGFDITLSPAGGLASPIPQNVQAFDGQKVVIEGYLLPVTMNNNGLAVEFLLLRNQSMCCYGVPPKINEWMTIQTSGQGVKPVMDQPILVAGTLHVGQILENGALAGLFRLDADKILGP